MFPLETVLFPYQNLPLHVFEPRYQVLVEECIAAGQEFGVVFVAQGSEVGRGRARALAEVGTYAHIEEAARLDEGRWAVLAKATRRLEVHTWLPDDPYPVALVTERRSAAPTASAVGALQRAERSVRRLLALESELGARAVPAATTPLSSEPEVALWELCALAPIELEHRQHLLELDDPGERALELVRVVEVQIETVVEAMSGFEA
jgi:Lon protease-like protein